jgi:WD40 repeat protein
VLDARAGAVLDARWLPDGTQVVTSHADGAARVWDATGGTLLTAVGHHSTWPHIDVSPDGRRLVTSADGVARMWTLDPDELVELAQSRVTRSFTQAECGRYGIEPCPSA